MGEGLVDLVIAHRGEHRAGGRARAQGGEAPLGTSVVGLQVDRGDRLDSRALPLAEMAQGDEVIGQRLVLIGGPGPHAVGELGLVDQVVLEGEQSEEQVAIGGGHGKLRGEIGHARKVSRQRERPGFHSEYQS